MSIEISDADINKILQGITIPPQPQILVDLYLEQLEPEPNIGKIAQLISQDVGLSGTILKIVNSASFGLASNISSISQAVMLLGTSTVINIVNGLSIKGELSDEQIVELNSFWDSAMDIAMVCASVAKQIGYANPDEAYALGLFHNVGIPLMMQKFNDFHDTQTESYNGNYQRVIDLENQRYKTNHAVIGYYTAKSWRLNPVICQTIADHHSLQQVFDSKNSDHSNAKKSLTAILKISEHICGTFRELGKQETDFEWERNCNTIFEFAGLGPYDIDQMRDQFIEQGIISARM